MSTFKQGSFQNDKQQGEGDVVASGFQKSDPNPGPDPVHSPLVSAEEGGRFQPQPKCQDAIWIPFFFAQLLAVISLSIYYFINHFDDLTDSNTKSKFIVLAIIIVIFSFVPAIGWIFLIKQYSEKLIWISLYLALGMWILFAIISIIIGDIWGLIISLLCCAIQSIWIYFVRDRIPFASAVLELSISASNQFNNIYITSFLMVFIQFLWIFIWLAGFTALVHIYNNSDDNDNNNKHNLSQGLIALWILSFYWTCQVIANISHVTAAGVVATWYFLYPTNTPIDPVYNSLKRASTTSLGSICFGSFLIALIQTFRAMIRMMRDRQNACILCLVDCILSCCETILEYINLYAFTTVAIYGVPYWIACKRTWNLFQSKGFDMIINDDLTGTALNISCIFSGLLTGGIAGIIAYFPLHMKSNASMQWAAVGFVIGFVMSLCTLVVVKSGVATIFVCIAEDPAALEQTKENEYRKITNAWRARYGEVPRRLIGP